MSIECGECEWDARAGHDPDCSRNPVHKLESERDQLRADLEAARGEIARTDEVIATAKRRRPRYNEPCPCGHVFWQHDVGSAKWHCEECRCGWFFTDVDRIYAQSRATEAELQARVKAQAEELTRWEVRFGMNVPYIVHVMRLQSAVVDAARAIDPKDRSFALDDALATLDDAEQPQDDPQQPSEKTTDHEDLPPAEPRHEAKEPR